MKIKAKVKAKVKAKLVISNRQRNILHDHPMMSKGGVMEKSKKSRRNKDKQSLKNDLDTMD